METLRRILGPLVAVAALAAMASASDGDEAAVRGGGIRLRLGNCTLGCGNKGFGVLAEYPAPGPGWVKLVRRTVEGAAKVAPTYFDRWGSICGLRIYDPDGNLAKYVEMAERLNGGLVESGGQWLEGPLQARLNDYILKWRPEDFEIQAAPGVKTPKWLGRYDKQELDPQSGRLKFTLTALGKAPR